MAHCVSSMAYVGDTPWHGLGNVLPAKQPLSVWLQSAGMDWQIESSTVRYTSQHPTPSGVIEGIHTFPEQRVLYRSDTKEPLSVVSPRYQVVQPHEVLEFYRDLTEVSGYDLETAGVLKGGKKFWALARTGQSSVLRGNDVVNGYLLLATSCDGTLPTTVTPTTVRVVCHNTLNLAVAEKAAIKVGHRSRFDPEAVKQQLGIAVSQWDQFMAQMRLLSERKVNTQDASHFLRQVFSSDHSVQAPDTFSHQRAMKQVLTLFDGQGRGSELDSAKGTAWGLLNAVTEYVDHEKRARSIDHRLDSAWFGQGAALKQKALETALLMAA